MSDINYLDRNRILNTLIKHETLLLDDLVKPENLGIKLQNKEILLYLLNDLVINGYVIQLEGIENATYTITDKGIHEGERLTAEKMN